MSDPSAVPPTPAPPPAPTPPAGPSAEELQRLDAWKQAQVVQSQAEARQAVLNEVAQQLGCSLEEAATRLKAATDANNAGLGEAERKLAEAQALGVSAAATNQAANQLILDTLKADALMDLGMTRNQARASVNLVQTPAEVTVESVVAAAKNVKDLFPAMFGTPSGSGGAPGAPVDSYTRGGPMPTGNAPVSAIERGRARFAQTQQRKEAS